MIRVDYIQEFVKLAECLSFTKASEDLFITQPSLSRHISLLESELGVKLIERDTRNVRMTSAGTELYKDFIQLLNAYRSVEDHARALSYGYRGQLTISVAPYGLADHLESPVMRFATLYPEINIRLNISDPEDGIRQLQDGKSDICLGFRSDTTKSDVVFTEVGQEPLCVVMSREHPCAGRADVSIRDLAQGKFVILENDESRARFRTSVQRFLAGYGVDPTQIIFTQNLATIGMSIQQTGAVCILMRSMGTLGRDYLVSVPLSDEDCKLTLFLLRKKNNDNEAAKLFFDLVSQGKE